VVERVRCRSRDFADVRASERSSIEAMVVVVAVDEVVEFVEHCQSGTGGALSAGNLRVIPGAQSKLFHYILTMLQFSSGIKAIMRLPLKYSWGSSWFLAANNEVEEMTRRMPE
jgi:hypothetical protein